MPRPRPAVALRRILGALVSGTGLIGKALTTPVPPLSVAERLAALPRTGLPVERAVDIYWNDHLVPFIDARSDDDLACALGYVSAHLRLGHIAVTRMAAAGRLAECFGPVAADLDASLRIIGFGRAAAATAAAMPAPTRRWVQRYVDGLNHYQQTVRPLPPDLAILGIEPEPWTVEDVVTMGRLAGNDINWLGWFRLLKWRRQEDWPAIWAEAVRWGGTSHASFIDAETLKEEVLEEILEGVAGSRTASGAALLANDPHVGIFLPSLFLIVGLRSPGLHAVGLTIPGVPFLAIGRNADICWGATNMRAASSDLVAVAGMPSGAVTTHEEELRVRWSKPCKVKVRSTPVGPVVSDAPLVHANGEELALRWMGHQVTDEITAMLDVARSRDFAGFRQALAPWGVSGQNFLYADRAGHIGQVMAVHLPRRHRDPPADVVLTPEQSIGWEDRVTAAGLPASLDPPEGFLASANNQPAETDVLVGYFFAANDRITRLKALIGGRADWTMELLAATQRDVVRGSAVRLRDLVLGLGATPAEPAPADLLRRLAGWDGAYDAARIEPALLELLAAALTDGLGEAMKPLRSSEAILDILIDRLGALPAAQARALIETAAIAAARRARGVKAWGDLHRLRLAHVLANIPVAGRRFPNIEPPVSGSTTTLMKTAHDLVKGRHTVRFGANARHVSDMADPDANWFVLLGGQDGYPGSPAMIDHVPLWQEGRYIKVPLELETVRAEFRHVTRLEPATVGASGA